MTAIQADSDYARTWFDNLSIVFQDEGMPKISADRGASRFMKIAFATDIKAQ